MELTWREPRKKAETKPPLAKPSSHFLEEELIKETKKSERWAIPKKCDREVAERAIEVLQNSLGGKRKLILEITQET